MNSLIIYLAPPVIGAFIGYITNAIAIKMLFRPLYPIKIGAFQLPFTPGILPREREKLADNIGRMVERELLTEEIIRQRLNKPDVVQALEQGVSTATKQILETKFDTESDLSRNILGFVVQLFHNQRFLESVEPVLTNLLENIQNRSIADFSGKQEEELQDLLRPSIVKIIEQILPVASKNLGKLLDSHYFEIKNRIIDFLRMPEIHQQLEIQGRIFLQKTLLKLNTFQRFFVSAAQYDKTLDERMTDIIEDLITQIDVLLSKEENRQALVQYTKNFIANLGKQPETVYQLSGMIYGIVFPLLHEPLESLIQKITGMDAPRQRTAILDWIHRWLQEISESSILELMQRFIGQHKDSRVGDILVLGNDQKARIDSLIAKALLSLANNKIADALKTIDVRSIVSERIDSLDMEDVERIVLDVMASQFKWINVFGAILGAIIGASQVLLSFYLNS